jgi:ribosomal protein S27AE
MRPGCDRCGGELIPGRLSLPLLGQARFSYWLRGRAVETEVLGHMCAQCGAVTFVAGDPELIRRAAEADRRAAQSK